MGGPLIPATPSPLFTRFFAGYCERMLSKSFARVRLARGSADALGSLERHGGPAIAAMNHASWWDPLVGLVLARRFAPSRVLASPIEAAQLRKFRFMRRIGLFGIDPTGRGSLRVLVDHACSLFEAEPRTLLGLTPQGAFTDVRTPVRLRPGAAAVAARLSASGAEPAAVSIACEYAFWFDKKPDLLIRASTVTEPSRPSTAGWARAIGGAMERDRLALAGLSVSRDEGAFEPLFGPAGSSIHPVYDLLLRLSGRRPRIRPGGTADGSGGPPGDGGDDRPGASGRGAGIEGASA
jgi:1-acyl-sn-glycerol-3-phosphate acyltransferase